MRIAGIDIATTTGFCLHDTQSGEWVPSSFRPKAKRPFEAAVGAVHYGFEGEVAREFRDHLLRWLCAEGIEAVGIEQPLTPQIERRRPVFNPQADFSGQAITYQKTGATSFGTIYRIYGLHYQAVEVCSRLNIPVHVIHQSEWRSSFIGVTRAPKGASNGTAWLKNKAKDRCVQLNIPVRNADQADAVGVCHHLLSILTPYKPRAGQLALEVFGK